LRHVIFRLDKDRYALPLDTVREVVNAPEHYSRVPHAKDSVKGVMTLRGRVVPVVDLGRLLTVGAQASGGKVVLLELSRRELGLLVSKWRASRASRRSVPRPGRRGWCGAWRGWDPSPSPCSMSKDSTPR